MNTFAPAKLPLVKSTGSPFVSKLLPLHSTITEASPAVTIGVSGSSGDKTISPTAGTNIDLGKLTADLLP